MKDHLLIGYLEGALEYVLQHHPGKDAPDPEDGSSVDSDDDSDNISVRDFGGNGGAHGQDVPQANGSMQSTDVVSARTNQQSVVASESFDTARGAVPGPAPDVRRQVRGPGGLHRGTRGPKKKVSWEEAEEIARSVHGAAGVPGVIPTVPGVTPPVPGVTPPVPGVVPPVPEAGRDVEMGIVDVHDPAGVPGVISPVPEGERDVEMGIMDDHVSVQRPYGDRGTGVIPDVESRGPGSGFNLGRRNNGAVSQAPDVEMGFK